MKDTGATNIIGGPKEISAGRTKEMKLPGLSAANKRARRSHTIVSQLTHICHNHEAGGAVEY